jgi:hypothetical protein
VIRLNFLCSHAKQAYTAENGKQKKLEAASARKTRAKLAAAMAAFGEVCPEESMGAAQTAEEGSQLQPEPAPLEGVEATQRSRSKLGQEQQKTR